MFKLWLDIIKHEYEQYGAKMIEDYECRFYRRIQSGEKAKVVYHQKEPTQIIDPYGNEYFPKD